MSINFIALFSPYFALITLDNVRLSVIDLQMAILIIMSKAEKNFLYSKLICLASAIIKVKFQATNPFYIATIDSTYLN